MGAHSLLGGGQGPRGRGFWFAGHHIAIVFSSLPGLETANTPQMPLSPCQEWAAESYPQCSTDKDTILTSGLHIHTHAPMCIHVLRPPHTHTHRVSDEGKRVQFFNFSSMYINSGLKSPFCINLMQLCSYFLPLLFRVRSI